MDILLFNFMYRFLSAFLKSLSIFSKNMKYGIFHVLDACLG